MSALRWMPRRRFVPQKNSQRVYHGFDAVGFVSMSGRAWQAFDIDGRALGSFPSRLQAIAAILHEVGGGR